MPSNRPETKPHRELRLFAMPLCGGLVYATVKVMAYGFIDSELFSGFLYGCIMSAVVGIPLLLLGDRRCPDSRARHVVSGLIQSSLIGLCYRGSFVQLLLISVAGGMALGGLYTLMLSAIERIPTTKSERSARRWGPVIAVPLSGGVTLGAVAVILFSSQPRDLPESLAAFFLFFLIGGLISMLVSWPVLWLVERFLTTRLRYVIGAVISSFLIWLLCAAPAILQGPLAFLKSAVLLPRMFWPGLIIFLTVGLVCGALYTVISSFFARCCDVNDPHNH